MSIASIRNYVESHLSAADQDVKDAWNKVGAYVTGEEKRRAAEVADLQSKGYTVIAPVASTPPAAVAPVKAS
jgi:hypothetical protein